MKRIIVLLMMVLITFCICTSFSVAALPTSTTTNYNIVNVEIKGNGGVTTTEWMVEANKGNTVTLEATEAESSFVFWNLIGSYNIVEGKATDKIFIIEPLSDILAIATFEDGVDEVAVPINLDKSSTSPKTGQEALPIYIIFIIIIIAIFGVFYSVKKIKYRKAYNKL